MMEFFVYNEESPDAKSLAMKLSEAKPGSLIPLTPAEMQILKEQSAFRKISIALCEDEPK